MPQKEPFIKDNTNLFYSRTHRCIDMSSTKINKDESKQTFHISVKIRDEQGKIFEGEGIFSKHIKVPTIDFEVSVYTWETLEYRMKTLGREFKTISPKGSDVSIEASIYNSIGDGWMCMASYYECEKRFVKH